MKKNLLSTLWLLAGFLPGVSGRSQINLPHDQNPNFAISRDKYMKMADSLNSWHSITLQETYKAIDWLADRKEARMDRRESRIQLRLERARWYGGYQYDNYNYNPYNRYRGGYYNNGYHRGNRSFYFNPWGYGFWWR